MRRIGLAVLITVVSLIAPSAARATSCHGCDVTVLDDYPMKSDAIQGGACAHESQFARGLRSCIPY
jgi:hypothetical protein